MIKIGFWGVFSPQNGIFVTARNINGDGFADLIAGGGPRVLAFDGKSLLTNEYVNLANFFGGDVNSRGGIRVAVKNLDGDTKADVVVVREVGPVSRQKHCHRCHADGAVRFRCARRIHRRRVCWLAIVVSGEL